MAVICYEQCKCTACSHYRLDKEERRMACFLEQDMTAVEFAQYQLRGAIQHQAAQK